MSNTLRTNNPKQDGGRIVTFVKMQIIALQFVSKNLIEHIKLHHVAKCSLQEKVHRSCCVYFSPKLREEDASLHCIKNSNLCLL